MRTPSILEGEVVADETVISSSSLSGPSSVIAPLELELLPTEQARPCTPRLLIIIFPADAGPMLKQVFTAAIVRFVYGPEFSENWSLSRKPVVTLVIDTSLTWLSSWAQQFTIPMP